MMYKPEFDQNVSLNIKHCQRLWRAQWHFNSEQSQILKIWDIKNEEEFSRSSWRWHCLSSLGKGSGCQRAEDSAAQLERECPNSEQKTLRKEFLRPNFPDKGLRVCFFSHFYFYGVAVCLCTLPLTWWQFLAFSYHLYIQKTVLDLNVLFRIW
jgi:hypothetical protein